MSFPRMSLHIGDYLKDTRHLRAAEHGAYLLLIMHYWATGGLPDDDKQLAAIACMSEREWRKHRPVIRPLFKEGWRHKRIDAELAETRIKYKSRVAAGKKGGHAKASNARFLLEQNSSNPNPNPSKKEPEQGKTSPTDGVEVVDGDGVIRFVPRGRA